MSVRVLVWSNTSGSNLHRSQGKTKQDDAKTDVGLVPVFVLAIFTGVVVFGVPAGAKSVVTATGTTLGNGMH